MSLRELISVARGQTPADLLLKNVRIINTFVGEIEQANVAIYGDMIAGVGDYDEAKDIFDLQGSFLAPGFINGHTHIESSMLHPARYAQAVVPRGTLAVVTRCLPYTRGCGGRQRALRRQVDGMTFWVSAHSAEGERVESCACHERRSWMGFPNSPASGKLPNWRNYGRAQCQVPD